MTDTTTTPWAAGWDDEFSFSGATRQDAIDAAIEDHHEHIDDGWIDPVSTVLIIIYEAPEWCTGPTEDLEGCCCGFDHQDYDDHRENQGEKKMKRTPVSARMRMRFEEHGAEFREEDFHDITMYSADGGYIGDAGDCRHFRWLARNGIWEPMLASPDGRTCAIGRATRGPHKGKWIGWSHRASCAFGVGSRVRKGDCAYMPDDKRSFILSQIFFWSGSHKTNVRPECLGDRVRIHWTYTDRVPNKALRGTGGHADSEYPVIWGRGEWTAETDDDARQMALDFALGVA